MAFLIPAVRAGSLWSSSREWPTIFVKGQAVNISDSTGHMVSVTVTQVCAVMRTQYNQ